MEEKDYKAEIITKFTSDKFEFFENVHKFSSYVNFLLRKHNQSSFYIENIYNGVIYFFRNYDNFYSVNLPYDPKFVEEFKLKKEHSKENLELMGNNIFPDNLLKNYPIEEIKFIYSIIEGDSNKLMPILKTHFKSYDEKDISIKEIDSKNLELIFKSKNALEKYLFERALLTTGLIQEYLEKKN